ncbi:unnamed protein product [Allacma fusca]|uniref:Uncharacterized protein n=1 Tax=Allacma fusca TaxID=39272 RepID=A0A8J2KSZ7_9HEXA|nr:unnamed protein product [Allacma fusca]
MSTSNRPDSIYSSNQNDNHSTKDKGKHGSDSNSDKQLESLVQKRATTANLTVASKGTAKALTRQKSMYDHVEIDFVKSGKKTHLFRLIVIGTHEEDPTEFIRYKRLLIEEINVTCHDELATGFFLAYPRQFVHVLEGSEDTLNKYLSRCAKAFESSPTEANTVKIAPKSQKKKKSSVKEDFTPRIPRVRMLVLGYFAIQDRFLPRWLSTKFNPPREVGNVEGGFRKNLYDLVRTTLILAIIMSKQPTLKNGEIDWPDQTDGPKTRERREQDMQLMQYLPSQHVIMYLMKDKPRPLKLKTPSEFIKAYWDVPDFILSSETVWPMPCRIAPYD